ncbi:MAG: ferredoxin [Firmicutes bacterium]|nr:ferredoxin [Bacillota bacterium]
MKKLCVNEEACIGCGACVAIDGAHFDFNEDGLSEVISNENVESEEAQNAISSCPTNAISYEEEIEADTSEEKHCECENCTCEDCQCDSGECHCPGCGEESGSEEKEECHCGHCTCEE